MRPWARWTARTALVAAGFAAAGGGLSGLALAGPVSTGTSGTITVLGGNGLLAPVSIPADVCGDIGGLLGTAAAGCGGGAGASAGSSQAAGGSAASGSSGMFSAGSGHDVHAPVSTPVVVCGNAVAMFGTASASCTGGASSLATNAHGANAGGPGNSAASTAFSDGAGPGSAYAALRQAFGDTLDAPGLGASTPGSTAVSQLAGLGSLPGLADLPSLGGPANLAGHGGGGGDSTLMAGGALRAANASGMSSDSFAALAIGALLAGAAALKIASRRARDRKAGIGATI
jgi:hypothetical protein